MQSKRLGGYTPEARTAMLEIAVNAAAACHDLTAFEPVEDADGKPNGGVLPNASKRFNPADRSARSDTGLAFQPVR